MNEGYNGTVLLFILGMGGLAAFLVGMALFSALRQRAEKASLQRKTSLPIMDGCDRFLRIGIAGGGCSGLRYALAFDNEFDPLTDTRFEVDGFAIVTRKKFAEFLVGGIGIMNSEQVFKDHRGESQRVKIDHQEEISFSIRNGGLCDQTYFS